MIGFGLTELSHIVSHGVDYQRTLIINVKKNDKQKHTNKDTHQIAVMTFLLTTTGSKGPRSTLFR